MFERRSRRDQGPLLNVPSALGLKREGATALFVQCTSVFGLLDAFAGMRRNTH